jgi:hypothetical protein
VGWLDSPTLPKERMQDRLDDTLMEECLLVKVSMVIVPVIGGVAAFSIVVAILYHYLFDEESAGDDHENT